MMWKQSPLQMQPCHWSMHPPGRWKLAPGSLFQLRDHLLHYTRGGSPVSEKDYSNWHQQLLVQIQADPERYIKAAKGYRISVGQLLSLMPFLLHDLSLFSSGLFLVPLPSFHHSFPSLLCATLLWFTLPGDIQEPLMGHYLPLAMVFTSCSEQQINICCSH